VHGSERLGNRLLPVLSACLHVDGDRPFIDLSVVTGSATAQGRFLLDTGGGGLLLTEALARRCGLPLEGKPTLEEWGLHLEEIPRPQMVLAGEVLELDSPAFVILESGAQGSGNMISGRALSQYRVVLDFPRRQFSLRSPSSIPEGVPLVTPVHSQTKFPWIEITVEGHPYGMLLDTGAGCTMISPRVLQQWRDEHPDWEYREGVRGSARKGRGDLDDGAVMLRVPRVTLGPFEIADVWMVARPVGGNFETFSARMMTNAAIGALGGNLLRFFRLEVDYATGLSYFQSVDTLPSTGQL